MNQGLGIRDREGLCREQNDPVPWIIRSVSNGRPENVLVVAQYCMQLFLRGFAFDVEHDEGEMCNSGAVALRVSVIDLEGDVVPEDVWLNGSAGFGGFDGIGADFGLGLEGFGQ